MLVENADVAAGKLVAKGSAKLPLRMPLPMLKLPGEWNTFELIVFEGSAVQFINGQRVYAITNIRQQLTGGKEEAAVAASHIVIGSLSEESTFFRAIEIREIDALPPEVAGGAGR
jgi:hypothetical protein